MEKISQIRELLRATPTEALPEALDAFREDERKGVRDLVAVYERKYQAYEKEKQRMYAMFSFERSGRSEGAFLICGVDEVGRGPFAGPVVAGAVILPDPCDILYLNDSKQLTAAKREELDPVIRDRATAVGIGVVSPERIDEVNILNATYEAMRDAIAALGVRPDLLLNDAVTIPGLAVRQVPIIHGDAKSASIAAASIVAKVYRDHLMESYDQVYPGYGFASNKGYGSQEHIRALRELGPCPIHRRSFIHDYI